MDAGRRVTHASGSHLLVVDDDRETRELLSLYLGQQGFDVAVVEDGEARDRAVRTGLRDGRHREVLEGLAPGEVVVLHPGSSIEDGARIRRLED